MSWLFTRSWDMQTGGRLHLQLTPRGSMVSHVDPGGAPPICVICDDIQEAMDIVKDYRLLDSTEAAAHV